MEIDFQWHQSLLLITQFLDQSIIWSYREIFKHWKDSSHDSFLVLFQNGPKDTPLWSNVNSICFRWRNLFHTSNIYIWEIITTEPFHRFLKFQKVNSEQQIRAENVQNSFLWIICQLENIEAMRDIVSGEEIMTIYDFRMTSLDQVIIQWPCR